jgi:lysozyme
MTTPHLANDISGDEGFRSRAYPDPLTGGEPWTCGFGCTGPDVGPKTVWSRAVAVKRRDAKIAEAKADLDRHVPWWRSLSDPRQDALVNMAFNMGWPKLSTFKRMLAALDDADYAKAADEMLASRWAAQVGRRAVRLATQMRTGVRVGSI